MRRTNKFKKAYKTRFTAEAQNCLKAGVTLAQITATIDNHFEGDGIPELLRKKWSHEVVMELRKQEHTKDMFYKEPTETISEKLYKWIKG